MAMPSRADLFGLLCAFVVVYCVLEDRWEPIASLALVLAAFAVALPRMVGRWKLGATPPAVEGEFERLKPPPQPDQAPARATGSLEG
jgi:hypothetical protein